MCARPSPAGSRKKIAAVMPKKIDVKPLKIITMTPEQWHKVPANPYQKAKRAQRIKIAHLRQFVEEHATVRMGIYPDGKRCKIDAHTRGDIWINRPWLVDFIPTSLRVECYPVANDEEAAERFKRCDNRSTAKNASDDVHGSFRLHGIPTESRLFQNASNIKTPLQYAYEIVLTSTGVRPATALKDATIDDYVVMFKNALTALDTIDVSLSRLKAPFITAFLLAHIKHGDKVIPFFKRVNDGTHGRKLGKLMCPIAAVEQKRDRWVGGGRTKHRELVAQVLGALDTFMSRAGFRDPNYQPEVDMQKIMEVDLNHYLTRARAKRTGRTLTR